MSHAKLFSMMMHPYYSVLYELSHFDFENIKCGAALKVRSIRLSDCYISQTKQYFNLQSLNKDQIIFFLFWW